MPAAVAIGVDLMTAFAAACPFNPEVDELDMAGALLGEPLEMVQCRTIDLEVPATAEIVLEGRIVPEITAPDGPFGEYHGYYDRPTGSPSSRSRPSPIVRTPSIRASISACRPRRTPILKPPRSSWRSTGGFVACRVIFGSTW